MKTPRSPRVLSGVAALSICALALTACGPDTSGDGPEEPSDIDWSSIEPADEITFASNHPGASVDIEESMIEAFTEETGIEVNLINSGGNYEETSQWYQTGGSDTADVVVLSDATWFPNYLNDSLLPLDDVLEAAEVDTDTYVEALYEDYNYEGSHYGVPYARSTPLFYYNADHYEEAGIEEVPETWEEVAEVSEKLMEADVADSAFVYPPQPEYPAWTMANLVWGYGGAWSEEWDFEIMSSDANVEALEFAQESTSDWASVASGDQADDFSAGVSSQMIQSTGSLGGVLESADFEVGVAFLPSGPEAEGETPTGGAGLMISASSTPEEQLAAAKFLGFVTNSENTAEFSAGTGYVPVRTDAEMSDVYDETPEFETAVDQLERARVQDYSRVFLPGGDLAISGALQEILTNDDVDVRDRLESLQEELEGLYETEIADDIEN
ncbi:MULTISPECIES: ABC transporter substrate-binding protein [Auritidibacter]|uniref:ABC transporter substrate-binding protein n=1 Tax=Auritidibacter TaxID=1160973 RepID=UPI000D726EB0|nr:MULTISPECIES: ABC transporter substrate-binding protein [Auritidibacter]AXR73112.1 ABC transporter substrate-binding protein [Auritidibacter sp. NML130574]NIH71553.1 sn-glycerol 3-phosphate transport system substrate-binding protein [Auritidibacter ignavus]PXA77387.1 ABC transporter substrate-binding protein [Auritidibacter sp. NML100628]PXA81866.1 ABC transporter substrate-binding protein [Auritidibacter sp. NML120636]RMX22540.1 ABC transporter substrate-binding protein [Auritidibacter ign